MTPADLIAFEAEIAEAYNRSEIAAPVHLSGGNEEPLIAYFAEHFRPGDWVLSTWRSHFHALLAGVPPEKVRAAILAGRSITLAWPEHRFLSSAIVGGTLPIAVGLAMGIKRCGFGVDQLLDDERVIFPIAGQSQHVHCFVGDMAARTGAFHEARAYAIGHDLPVTFIIEDNGKSVMTDTEKVWSPISDWVDDYCREHAMMNAVPPNNRFWIHEPYKTVYYEYELGWPHSGAGKWIAW